MNGISSQGLADLVLQNARVWTVDDRLPEAQAVAGKTRPELMITHEPGHMFLTDLTNEDLAAL